MDNFTPGPWRWQFNAEHKTLSLVGGRPQYDLTVMDFDRRGMRGAIPRVRDLAHDGMNILHRVCDRPDWIVPFPGRHHHAHWCADVTHADMRLMAAAPDLLYALRAMLNDTTTANEVWADGTAVEQARAAIAKATGDAT